MNDVGHRRAERKVQFVQRGQDKPRLTTEQKRAARRVRELSRIYYQQYPHGLPHNGLGVKYARYMLRTMAWLPDDRRAQWLDRHAPWIDVDKRADLLRLGAYWYAARSLGEHLELDDETREAAMAWSIEAVDVTCEERKAVNREKDRLRRERHRRKNGAKPHAQSVLHQEPWTLEGVSRRTWYRRRKASGTDSSEPSLILTPCDVSVPSPAQAAAAEPPPQPSRKRQGRKVAVRVTNVIPFPGQDRNDRASGKAWQGATTAEREPWLEGGDEIACISSRGLTRTRTPGAGNG